MVSCMLSSGDQPWNPSWHSLLQPVTTFSYDKKQHFHLACLKPLVVNLVYYLLNKLKILEFDSNKTKECLVLSSFIVISIFVVFAYGFWELRGKNPVLSWIERVEKSERINFLSKEVYIQYTHAKYCLCLLTGNKVNILEVEMSKGKKKMSGKGANSCQKKSLCVCFFCVYMLGSHKTYFMAMVKQSPKAIAKVLWKEEVIQFSALCPAQKKERQTRAWGEEERGKDKW